MHYNPNSEVETLQHAGAPVGWDSGVSVVICCHNSATRLRPTLEHLAVQRVSPGTSWEVIVVDNACTDHTVEAARSIWPANALAPLRVISEPRLGLAFARERGFDESTYEYVAFVDDDNWLDPVWVQTAASILDTHPDVGMCGGQIEPILECTPPAWFEAYKKDFALGTQGTESGYAPDYLWGAGLCIRKRAWQSLISSGFKTILVDRRGTSLTAGGDTEICLVLMLAGWRPWFDAKLVLRHYIPRDRLNWMYLRKLWRGFGAARILLEAYLRGIEDPPSGLGNRLRSMWPGQILRRLRGLFYYRRKLVAAALFPLENDHQSLQIEYLLGQLQTIAWNWKVYKRRRDTLRNEAWLVMRQPTPHGSWLC